MPNWGKDFTEGLKAGRAVRKSWDEGRKEDEERAWRIKEGDVQAQAQWRAENNLRKGEGLEPLPRPEPYQEPQGWDKVKDILGLGPVRAVPPASARGWPSTLADLLQTGTAAPEFGGEAEAELTSAVPRNAGAFIRTGGLPQVAGASPGAGGMVRTGGGGMGGKTDVSATGIYNYLTQTKGVSPAHAIGIVANIDRESGFNPSALHDKDAAGNPTGYGMFGHRLDRRDGLFAYAKSQQPSWQQQVDYALIEPEGRKYLQQDYGNDSVAATQAFVRDFERPKDVPGELAARAKIAAKYASLMPAAAPQTPPVASGSIIPLPATLRRT
jgi:hypothetical protein